jgi:hypothetical protein
MYLYPETIAQQYHLKSPMAMPESFKEFSGQIASPQTGNRSFKTTYNPVLKLGNCGSITSSLPANGNGRLNTKN